MKPKTGLILGIACLSFGLGIEADVLELKSSPRR
jgi:hypothetical protein